MTQTASAPTFPQVFNRSGRWYTKAEPIPGTEYPQFVVAIQTLFESRPAAHTFAFSEQQAQEAQAWIVTEFDRLWPDNKYMNSAEHAARVAVGNYNRQVKGQ